MASLGWEDIVLDGLEGICSLFDSIYFIKTLGIITDKSFLYRKIIQNNFSLKLWLATLLLIIKKLVVKLFQNYKILRFLKIELKQHINNNNNNNKNNHINSILLEKLNKKINQHYNFIKLNLLDLIQNLLYCAIVIIELLKLKISKKSKFILELLANSITIVKHI
ncbi:hypothetical protein Kpol_2002p13 [Vanderwaltozyma polyspora DSM 70294]|uniref:Uncharacterized protein n=1 Tax=Vanderwaltozyma polyspora (strain ATCC 22028 / DSM 70294 / BCRC 21397 / CBS 2163 / NBRC 10782 / NRRL Y-8283 / UCD 57-17) TaxID=436907 RepID=A7TFC9_VANPO|nr:uncharacterized protein Kpol_2002p13 [Vanderwaltozyma polyspora DSM 70294]EDO18943.1 hypothetical protein Kpol_2002p13 [Vanderwaltozyma polyspora DSM 70294]